jgi:hypothetical protein
VTAARSFVRLATVLVVLCFVSAAGARPIAADNTASQQILPPGGGEFVGGIGEFVFPPLTYSTEDQLSSGTMTLSVVDGRGLGHGWSVTVSATDFVLAGSPASIPAANFAITAAGAVEVVRGQAVGPDGPRIPVANSVGSLDQARLVLEAAPHAGNGAYTQRLDVRLLVPGGTEAGTYVAGLVVTISSGL